VSAPAHRIHSALYDKLMAPQDLLGLARQRQRTAGAAAGRVLELGIGTGRNLAHYGDVEEVVGVEPDPHMLGRAEPRTAGLGFPVRLVQASAEALPFADSQFDTIVVALALCTIPDPDAALREARRVLKPNGRMHFLEHVRSSRPGLARFQDLITPCWRLAAGGCHPNRDTVRTIGRYFEIEHLWAKGVIVQGSARAARGEPTSTAQSGRSRPEFTP
jgi:ubiquinone/menaquinone biosynthesis C-methylase UbiE